MEKDIEYNDGSDWYFTKVISIIICAIYIAVMFFSQPFKVKSNFPNNSIFSISSAALPIAMIKLLFVITLVLIIAANIISIVFLAKGRSKASFICDGISSLAAFLTFGAYPLTYLRFHIKPDVNYLDFSIFYIVAIYFLINGIVRIIQFKKDEVKLRFGYYIPTLFTILSVVSVWSLCAVVLTIPMPYDNYYKDYFEHDPALTAQAENYLRGGVSVDGNIYCVSALSENEYGLIKINSEGEQEILDTAVYIPVKNLAVGDHTIYYLKYNEYSEDVYIACEWTEGTSYFKLCALDIDSGEIKEYGSEEFPDDIGKSLYYSVLIGIRDGRLFLMTRSIEDPLCFEHYTIDVSGDEVSMSSISRYSWDIYSGGWLLDYDDLIIRMYSCLICDHSNFDVIDHEGYRYELDDIFLYQCFQNDNGRWIHSDTNSMNCVVDFNVYNDTLYILRYNKNEECFELYAGNDLSNAECISTFTLPLENTIMIEYIRLLVSDGYICIIDDTDIYTVSV